jgi:creatinine amidohydrolase
MQGCGTLALLFAMHACMSAGSVMSQVGANGAPSDPSAPPSLFLADLTSDELRAAVANGFTTALVYSGSTEGSGPALALGKHNVRAPYYAARVASSRGGMAACGT